MNNKCMNCAEKCPHAELMHQVALGRMNAINEFIALLKKVESGEFAPVVHGRWKYEPIEFSCEKDIKCSECGYYVERETDYCPYCGAKMDGGTDNV